MELFGKVTAINLVKEGVAKLSGNKYQIHQVIINGADNVAAEVYGTADHLAKFGLIAGAEGKFSVKTEVSEYNGKFYQRMSIVDISRDFTPLANKSAEKTEAQMQHEVIAEAANAAKPAETPAPSAQPEPMDDLPF